MQFQSKTDEQIQRESLIPAGEYNFQVISAKDTKSKKSGVDMIALELSVYVEDKERICRDYLMESMAFKLRHFAYAVGLGAKYDAGSLCAADCDGRSGVVKLVVQDSPGYGPQNSVKDYIIPDAKAEPALTGAAPAPMRPVTVADPSEPPY